MTKDKEEVTLDEQVINQLIGKNLKTIAKTAGASQADVGEPIKVSMQQVQKYMSGQNRISAAKLCILCNVLGIDIKQVLPLNETHKEGDIMAKKDIFRKKQKRLSEEQQTAINDAKLSAENTLVYFNLAAPNDSEEKRIAIQKLREAVMWLVQAATKTPVKTEEEINGIADSVACSVKVETLESL